MSPVIVVGGAGVGVGVGIGAGAGVGTGTGAGFGAGVWANSTAPTSHPDASEIALSLRMGLRRPREGWD